MQPRPEDREKELFSILDSTLPVIRLTLASFYQLTEKENEAFEDTLCVWFYRVARRLGASSRPTSDLREQLLFVAFKYARAFQLAKHKAGEHAPEGLALALARSPEEVAWEISTRLDATKQ